MHECPDYKEGQTMDLIKAFTNEQLKETVPTLNIGDTVRIHNRIKEGTRERIQLFEGTIIAKHGGGISETFTSYSEDFGNSAAVLSADGTLEKLNSFSCALFDSVVNTNGITDVEGGYSFL
jgi:hypothetical protein